MQPTRLGPYTITRRLGRGGMGAVYEAENAATGEAVAVKTLATHLVDDDGLRRRFQAEIETLKTLRHPGIVQLLAFGEEEGEPYFVMELVRGQSLEQLLRAGRRFSWQETVTIAADIARSLKAAHDHGVVHRDLKPANLLFIAAVDAAANGTADGRTPEVKLADFGIARLFGDSRHTMAGTVVGTAEYMAPEQASGGVVDPRADLYALGLVMFAMLAGKPPFHGGTADQLLERHRREPPPRVATLVPEVPTVLDALIDRLLAKDPAQRPASALALGRLLAAIEQGADGPSPGSPASEALPPEPHGDRPRQVDLFTATWEMPASAAATEQPVVIFPTHPAGEGRFVAADAATGPLPGPVTAAGFGRRDTHPDGQRPTHHDPARPRSHEPTVPITTADRDGGEASSRTHYTTVADLDAAARARGRQALMWTTLARAAAFATLVGILSGGAWALLRRPVPDDLYDAILATVAANPDRIDGLKDALPDIGRFLDWYPQDARAATIRTLQREVDLDRLAARARLRERKTTPPHLRIERDYRLAVALKPTDLSGSRAALEAILAMPRDVLATPLTPGIEPDPLVRDPDLWLALVREQLRTLAPLSEADARATLHDAARKQSPSERDTPSATDPSIPDPAPPR